MTTTVELIVTKSKQLYPKTKYNSGDYAIVSCNISETISGFPKLSQWGNMVVKGNMPYMKNNVRYRFIGIENYDEDRGTYSYDVGMMDEVCNELTEQDFELYLQDVLTESQFKKIKKVKNLKVALDNKDIKALMSVKGIGQGVATTVLERYHENKANASSIAQLSVIGVSIKMREKLLQRYKSYQTIIEILKENPYALAEDVDGIGFTKADELAQKSGMKANDPKRIRGFIYHTLNTKANEGQSYIKFIDLLREIIEKIYKNKMTEEGRILVGSVIEQMKREGICWLDENEKYIGLYEVYLLEKDLAKEIIRISSKKNNFKYDKWEQEVKQIEKEQGWEYTDEQKQGILTSLRDNFVMVVGKAGSGKTTVTNAMSRILSKNKYTISQACLSGKASLRMQEATGRDSSTIHRLLDFAPSGGFKRNKNNPLTCDVLIIDEVSMVDTRLMLSLLRAVKDTTKVIFLGDPAQLPSIGLGNIMTDLLNNRGFVSIVELTQIHRQAQKSAIITKSIEMRANKQITPYGYEGCMTLGELQDLTLDITPHKVELPQKVMNHYVDEANRLGNIMSICIVGATKVRGDMSCYNLNYLVKNWLNPISDAGIEGRDYIVSPVDKTKVYKISLGDKVLITKNNYNAQVWNEKESDFIQGAVFNGNLGVVKEIGEDYVELVVEGVGLVRIKENKYNTLELGYAVTVHKSQGSQWDTVIVAMDMGGYTLLSSEWGYTAITRAQKKCVVITEPNAIHRCCSNNLNSLKYTFLGMILHTYKEERGI